MTFPNENPDLRRTASEAKDNRRYLGFVIGVAVGLLLVVAFLIWNQSRITHRSASHDRLAVSSTTIATLTPARPPASRPDG
jgi:hypothetical protein